MAARIDPTVMIGGTLPILGTGHRVGKGKTIILESCEYCNSFLSFYQMCIRDRCRARPCWAMSSPSNRICPWVGLSKPPRRESKVVFPHPEGPRMA